MIKQSVLLIVLVLIFGCRQKSGNISDKTASFKSDKPNTFISGYVENPHQEYIVLSKDSYHDTAYFDKQNNFAFKLHLNQAAYFKISEGKSNFKIYIEPSDKLQLSFNSNNIFYSIQFAGKGSEANNYIKGKYLLMLDYALPLEQLYEKPVKEFRHWVDSLYVINKIYFTTFVSKNPSISTTFRKTEFASITYDRASQLMEYLVVTSNSHSIDETSYLEFLNQLSVNESELLDVYEYKLFLSAFIDFHASKKYQTENLLAHEITLIKLQTITNLIDNQEVKDYLLFAFLRDHVKYYGYRNTELLFKVFEFQCKNEQMRQGILTPYYEYVKLSQKQKAAEISMIDMDGIPTAIQHFKGSYLYIDVWATWCMPCRKEMPLFEELKDKYKHKNIEFISISIDQKQTDWIEFLTLKNFKKNQFLVTDIQPFLDAYLIKTIPHFLIIDDKGNLIDNDAPRPSDKDTNWLDEIPDKMAL